MELNEIKDILSKNRIQDVSWLCSLSESELDENFPLYLSRLNLRGDGRNPVSRFINFVKSKASGVCVYCLGEDMLVSLKLLVLQRAKIIGHEELAEKFDLKMLRALALILMEYSKGKIRDLSLTPGSAEPSTFMDGCNLLKFNPMDIMSIEELESCINIDSRRPPKRRLEDADLHQKKQKAKRS